MSGPASGSSSPASTRRRSSSSPPRRKNAGLRPSPISPYWKTGRPSSAPSRLASDPSHRDGPRHVLRNERDDGNDVGHADSWMDALVPAQVDPLDGEGNPVEKRVDQLLVLGCEREDGPVVIGVGVVSSTSARAANACAIDPRSAASRPSETLGTASSTIRTLRSRVRERLSEHVSEQLAHVRPAARLPAPVQGLAGRLVHPRDRLAGDRHPRARPHRRRHQRARRRPGHATSRAHHRRDRRARPRPRRADVRAARYLRATSAGRRVRPARRALLALPATVVRLLRPQPDGAAHVPGDNRSPVGPLLPRLRPDLLRAARRDDRRRDGRPLLLPLGARARGPRDHAGHRAHGVPLQPRVTAGPARRAADAGRRGHRRGGVHHGRPRREVLRAGADTIRALRERGEHRLPKDAGGQPADERSTCRC